MSTTCEPFTIAVSSLIDGELPAERHLDVIDHLVDCDRCRIFYRRARVLGAWTAAAESEGDESLPEGLWARIATAANEAPQETNEAHQTPAGARAAADPTWRTWLPSLAAALLLAVGLWTAGALGPFGNDIAKQIANRPAGDGIGGDPVGGGRQAGALEVELEGDRGRMTEDRFVALATEVLRADRRYHLEMLEIMSTVTAATGVREGFSGDRDDRDEPSERAPTTF